MCGAMERIKKHKTHVSAKEYKHRAKGTYKQAKQIARKLRIPYKDFHGVLT